ncbi:MAG TPA: hypothetical protein PLE30_00965 [Candidatus Kapabacteria bacterium]|nr:hypothetical protein [Candidatus Kapabacteria bacterium]
MKKIALLFVLTIAICLVSCGEKVDEIKNTAEVIQNMSEAGEKVQEANDLVEKKIQERKSKGDTLAMNFNDLMKYLPSTIDGYTASEPEGSSTNAMGFSFSQVSRSFSKTSGDNTQDIRIELIDYNASYAYLSGLAYWTNMNISTESTNGFERTVKTDIDNVFAYEKYQKDSKTASIMYVVAYRFILNIEGNGIDNIEVLKSVVNKIDLKKLASL